jgi:dienelactone hydrolase
MTTETPCFDYQDPGTRCYQVRIPVGGGGIELEGDLRVPDRPRGVVLVAHGSGSSRKSPRNRYVAGVLNAGSMATLLMDLLTPDEERSDAVTGQLRLDIGFLADRLAAATDWLELHPELRNLPIGYFGASTGGGAALVAAAARADRVAAIASRSGRPDLAGPALQYVTAPTLLIVGGEDTPVIRMNEQALQQIRAPKRLVIVPGATHLFEEPGALEEVADLALQWFDHYFTAAGATPRMTRTNEYAGLRAQQMNHGYA